MRRQITLALVVLYCCSVFAKSDIKPAILERLTTRSASLDRISASSDSSSGRMARVLAQKSFSFSEGCNPTCTEHQKCAFNSCLPDPFPCEDEDITCGEDHICVEQSHIEGKHFMNDANYPFQPHKSQWFYVCVPRTYQLPPGYHISQGRIKRKYCSCKVGDQSHGHFQSILRNEDNEFDISWATPRWTDVSVVPDNRAICLNDGTAQYDGIAYCKDAVYNAQYRDGGCPVFFEMALGNSHCQLKSSEQNCDTLSKMWDTNNLKKWEMRYFRVSDEYNNFWLDCENIRFDWDSVTRAVDDKDVFQFNNAGTSGSAFTKTNFALLCVCLIAVVVGLTFVAYRRYLSHKVKLTQIQEEISDVQPSGSGVAV